MGIANRAIPPTIDELLARARLGLHRRRSPRPGSQAGRGCGPAITVVD